MNGTTSQGTEQTAAELVGLYLLRLYLDIRGLLGGLSGLADADGLHPRHAGLLARAPVWRTRSRPDKAAQGKHTEALSTAPIEAIKAESEADGLRYRRWQGGVRRQLRWLPRQWRPGCQGLPQPERRRLDLGRQARRISSRRSSTVSAMATTRLVTAPCRVSACDGTCCSPIRSTMRPSIVLSLAKKPHDAAAADRGKAIFADSDCAACHGDDGKGNHEIGSANLTANTWIYGGAKADIVKTIQTGRGGVMPAWGERSTRRPSRSWPSTSTRWAAVSNKRRGAREGSLSSLEVCPEITAISSGYFQANP